MKSVLLKEVYFNEDRLTLEIIDNKNIKRYLSFHTDKFKEYCKNIDGNRRVIVGMLKEMAWEQDDPTLQTLISDASYVTEYAHSINSWIRDDYIFPVTSRT
mgnify:CR=1 FL=1